MHLHRTLQPANTQPARKPLRLTLFTALFAVLALFLTACGSGTQSGNAQDQNSQSAPAGGETQQITDVLDRTVTVPTNPERILLDGQRLIYTTAFLNPDNPLDKVVGWPGDLKENDIDTYNEYVKKFPDLAKLPDTGEIWDNSFNLEKALQLRPQVFVMGADGFDAAKDAGIIDGFEKAGVPVVTVDYFVEPVDNTVPSVRIMGKLFNQQERADKFIDFYESKVSAVTDKLKAENAQPTKTLLWRAPGYFECCQTFKDSNLSKIVKAAGGANIGDTLLNAQQGSLSPEAVAKENPDVILATGADWSPDNTPVKKGNYVPMGYDISPETAAQEWQTVINNQPVIKELDAVKNHRSFVTWHHFYDSPYNFLAIEWFAQALHPDLFKDLNPQADFEQLHKDFLPVDAKGVFWTGLPQ